MAPKQPWPFIEAQQIVDRVLRRDPAPDEIVMILPQPRSIMPRSTA